MAQEAPDPDETYRDPDWLEEKYHGQGMTAGEIGELCGVEPNSIYFWMRTHGIDRRGSGPREIGPEALLEDLRSVARELGRAPTVGEYRELGDHHYTTVARRFGTWSDGRDLALEGMGLDTPRGGPTVAPGDLLEDVERVAREIGRVPTRADYDEHGAHSSQTVATWCGSWRDAKLEAAAGLDLPDQEARRLDRADLLRDLRRVIDEVDGRLTCSRYDGLGAYSSRTMRNRFGSWDDAKAEASREFDMASR